MSKQKMGTVAYGLLLLRVGRSAFVLAPSAGITRLVDSIIQATLPIATTYFAALTTTALASAYTGDEVAAGRVYVLVVITAVIGIVMLLWNSASAYIIQKTRYQVESTVEDDMMQKFSELPFDMYDDKEVVDLHERAKRFSFFFGHIFDTLGGMLTNIISVIAAVVALVIVSPWLALAVFLATIPGIFIQIRLARQQASHWDTNITRRRRKNNLGWMLQDSQYIAEMRVYGVVKHLIKLHAKLRDADEKERLDLELRTIWKTLAADVGEALVELGALLWVVVEIVNRQQPVGQFLYVQQLVSRALGQAGTLARNLGNIDQDLANIADYQLFMELVTAPSGGKQLKEAPQEIRVENVSFSYPKTSRRVLDDVSLTIRRGQHVAIVGENGAGKTTLIKLIMGLYRPSQGSIFVDKTNLIDIDPSSWHKFIGLLDQNYVKYYFATIRENVTLGDVNKKPTDALVEQAIKSAEFADVVASLERGDDTFIERWMADNNDEASATELSGGQYQRLALARNFYRDAPVMILDEPTSAIDALAESRIFKRLFSDKTDKTIIAISHRLSTIKKADVVFMMKNGRIIETGTADELIGKAGEFYAMFESQIK